MTTKMFGARVPRVEDQRFLRGNGRYVDDVAVGPLNGLGTLHAAVLRSPHAHAKVLDVDVDAVLAQAQAEADELAAEVRRALEALEEDGADRLFDEIYAEPHQELERQRREHALYLQQFDDEEAGA